MNKSILIEKIAKDADLSKAASERALVAVMNTIVSSITKGEAVQLMGFGSFRQTHRKARAGRNPKTGEPIKISAAKSVRFTPGSAFKEILNKRK